MYVIGHYDCSVQAKAFSVSPKTGFQSNAPNLLGQYPAMMSRKRYENGLVVALVVRKMTSVFVFPLHLPYEYHA
jgi:hypothetical protein